MATFRLDQVTSPAAEQLLPVPVPDWPRAQPVWSTCWPAHVYGFGFAFLLAAMLSVASPPYCFRCRRSAQSTAATSTVNSIVGAVCLGRSGVLLVDAYHSEGRLPVALVQMVHGLVFPGIVATLTILDRIFSALVKPRQQLGSIKHPRLITTALTVYLLSTSATYLVISVRPQTRLWLLLCQVVSLAWGCASVFLVACQCLRLARYARVTARSRRQTAMYIRAKRHVQRRLDTANDSERRCQLLKHLARLRVARTKSDEFVQQQQRMMSGVDERSLSDVDLQPGSSTTDSSDRQLHSDLEVTRTTTVRLSRNHLRYRRRSRRRRHVTGSGSKQRSSDAVRDFTVTALAAARLLWSPSPDSDGPCDDSTSWQVYLCPSDRAGVADCRRKKQKDTLPVGDKTPHDHHTSTTGTDSDNDNDVGESDSLSEYNQHPLRTDATNAKVEPGPESIPTAPAAGHDEILVGQQLEPPSLSSHRQQTSSADASSRTCLLLDNSPGSRPLSNRLTTATARLLQRAASQWRKSSAPVIDIESRRRIACVAESYTLNADHHAVAKTGSSFMTGNRRRRSHDTVVFENRAYDVRDDVTTCTEEVVDVKPGTSLQSTQPTPDDECQLASSGYLADTEFDNVDCRHDPDAGTSSLPLPSHSIYLGLSRLRNGRTVRLVWRAASVAVTSASVVCCLYIYSMLGVFGVLSNDRPAAAWPWFAFQTLDRYDNFFDSHFFTISLFVLVLDPSEKMASVMERRAVWPTN